MGQNLQPTASVQDSADSKRSVCHHLVEFTFMKESQTRWLKANQ